MALSKGECPNSVQCKIGASILNCNLVDIIKEVKILVDSGVDFVHLDVMDGNFVDDITFGPSFIASLIKQFRDVYFEVHMMVEFPVKFIKKMSSAGVKKFIFHYEITKEAHVDKIHSKSPGCSHCLENIEKFTVDEICDLIRENKMSPVLAINPETEIDRIIKIPYLNVITDGFLIMTVKPGKGGQKFMFDMMPKTKLLRQKFPQHEIGLDGGVSIESMDKNGGNFCAASRAVIGSALLRSNTKSQDIIKLRRGLYPDNKLEF